MNMSTKAFGLGDIARGMRAGSFNGEPGGLSGQIWLAGERGAEVRRILRQNELAFRLFVAVSVAVCGLILLAMFLG